MFVYIHIIHKNTSNYSASIMMPIFDLRENGFIWSSSWSNADACGTREPPCLTGGVSPNVRSITGKEE